jgi:hypothetical protein
LKNLKNFLNISIENTNNIKTINGRLEATHISLSSMNSILFSNNENTNFFFPFIFFSIEVANLFLIFLVLYPINNANIFFFI